MRFAISLASIVLASIFQISYSQICSGTSTRTSMTGSITDGSGSGNYNDNMACSWLIQAPDAKKVFLVFNLFQTEPGYDFLTIYDGSNAQAPRIFRASGTLSTPFVLANATSPTIFITFTTDTSIQADGFDINYVIETSNGCSDTTYNMRSGAFTDRSYAPLSYHVNGSNCHIYVQPFTPESVVQLSFLSFDLQDNNANVTINNGPVNTGSTIPGNFFGSRGQTLDVYLNVIPGARAEYLAMWKNNYCYGTQSVTGLTGVITDGSGSDNYENRVTCTWIIEPFSPLNSTSITFNSFTTQRNSDFLRVYDGNNTIIDTLLLAHSGVTPPSQIIVGTKGRPMMLVFQTDATTVSQGWNISFTRVEGRDNPTILTGGAVTGGTCGVTNPGACVCPDGVSSNCPLLPDMTASAKIIADTMQETPGRLKLSNATPNIGWGPLELHPSTPRSCFCSGTSVSCTISTCADGTYPSEQVIQTTYQKINGTITSSNRIAGTVTYHPSHAHVHVDNWASFTLRKDNGDPNPLNWPIIGSGSKVSFCLVNLGDCSSNLGYCVNNDGITLSNDDIPNYGFGTITGCNVDQGIFAGYLDIYDLSLPGQEIVLPPGVCNGNYHVVSITDPENKFLEVDENNNFAVVPVTLRLQQNCTSNNTFTSGSASVSTTRGGSVGTTAAVGVSTTRGASVSTTRGPSASTTGVSIPVTTGDSNIACQTFTCQQVPKRIPQNPAETAGDSDTNITISASHLVSQVNVIDVIGNHTYIGDLNFFLQSPAGTIIQLVTRRCDGSQNFQFSFFDSADAGLYPCPPTGGNWRPMEQLSAFVGEEAQGDWTLHIVDNAGDDFGVLIQWKLQVCWDVRQVSVTSGPLTTEAVTTQEMSSTDDSTTGMVAESEDSAAVKLFSGLFVLLFSVVLF